MSLVHGTCVAIAGSGVLIRGPSGAGKSDLALRLIDAGATLVADDYCEAEVRDDALFLCVPAATAGKMEVRGFGIVRLAHLPSIKLALVVDIVPEREIERLPETTTAEIDGIRTAWMNVDAATPSAAAKVRLAVRALVEGLRIAP